MGLAYVVGEFGSERGDPGKYCRLLGKSSASQRRH